MAARRIPVVAFAIALSACAAPPDSFEGAYDSHSGHYGEAMKQAIHAYEGGEISQAEMQERLSAAAVELARADAATAQSEQRELSTYAHPPPAQAAKTPAPLPSPAPAAGDTGNACLLIPCPESPTPPTNAGP
jgi:hypothetical protein